MADAEAEYRSVPLPSVLAIAMCTGTDVAMESAGITLVKGDLRCIVQARRLSRATMRNSRQNLFFAFIYNGLGIPLAAGALFPFFGILLSPMIAAAAMSFSSVSVIGKCPQAAQSRNLKGLAGGRCIVVIVGKSNRESGR